MKGSKPLSRFVIVVLSQSCAGKCSLNKDCVQCLVFKSGVISAEDCKTRCKDFKINEVDELSPGKAQKVVKLKRTQSSCINSNRFGSITELWFCCQKWVKGAHSRMTMTARLASAIRKILAKMSRYLYSGRKVLIALRYVTLHYVHYIKLRYVTVHYITLHLYLF